MNSLATDRFLVLGAGSIGRRHLSNLRQLGARCLAVCDRSDERMAPVLAEAPIPAFNDLDQALREFEPEAVLICTPPSVHVPHALAAIRAGAHVFVEKPVSHSMEGLTELMAAAQAGKRLVQVGYNLRFHSMIQHAKQLLDEGAIGRVLWARAEFGQYLPDWRPWQDYRQSYTARKALGGGILLDASHEVDCVTWLLGWPTGVFCLADHASDLEVDVEDSATLLLHYANGTHADVHVDFLQRAYSRGGTLAGESGTITWDFVTRQVRCYRSDSGEWETREFAVEPNDMYLRELEAFVMAMHGGSPPLVTLQQAARVLQIILAAKVANSCLEPLTWQI